MNLNERTNPKASCFPAQVLFNCWRQGAEKSFHAHVIDACAAPGNKTTHLASLFSEYRRETAAFTYEITAVEQDPGRAAVLRRRLTQAGADGPVRVVEGDFLQLDLSAPSMVSACALLLDPSCSGSGMLHRSIERQAHGVDEERDAQLARIEGLRRFQLQALLKALGHPRLTLVVYSTCSLHLQENEAVVAEALHWQSLHGGGWRLVSPAGFEDWSRRGERLPVDAFWPIRYTTAKSFPGKEKGRQWTKVKEQERRRLLRRTEAMNKEGARRESKEKGSSSKKARRKEVGPSPHERRIDECGLSLSEEERLCLLRCFPEDGTNGFFVAAFTRDLPQGGVEQEVAGEGVLDSTVDVPTARDEVAAKGSEQRREDAVIPNERRKRRPLHRRNEGVSSSGPRNSSPSSGSMPITSSSSRGKATDANTADGAQRPTEGSIFGLKRFRVQKSRGGSGKRRKLSHSVD